ncbi:MAG: hypothetical protein IJL47_07800 [Lachnospiraceae bacterium]|nr:hypothetical protein [Lachnospiraceae bacterium]
MSYYRPYIIAAILLILLLSAVLCDAKKKLKGWHIILWMAVILVSFFIGRDQSASDIALYDKIYAGNEITVTDDKGTRSYPFSPEIDTPILYPHAGEKPLKAKEKDIQNVAEIAFVSPVKKSKVTLQLCRIVNTDRYPEEAVFNYRGTNYCLLSTKFLYKNAFLYLEDGYAAQLIELVLQG